MKNTAKLGVTLAAMSLMTLSSVLFASANENKQGWAQENGNWYYYNAGVKLVNSWANDASGKWYFLGEDGKMVTKKIIDNNNEFVVKSDEVTDIGDQDYYYVGADGAMVTGWSEISLIDEKSPTKKEVTGWYFFGTDGRMFGESWINANNAWYYIGADGRMYENSLIEDGKYYVDDNGKMVTGWYQLTEDDEDNATGDFTGLKKKDWIYAKDNGELVKSGWKKINSKWYYFGEVSQAAAGVNGLGESFATSGAQYYQMQKEGFVADGSDHFYLGKNGDMATGWLKLEGKEYYAAEDGVLAQSEVQKLNNKYYYFDANGFYSKDDKYASMDNSDPSVYTLQSYADDAAAKAAVDKTTVKEVYKLGTGTIWK